MDERKDFMNAATHALIILLVSSVFFLFQESVATAMISGTVFEDRNGNGQMDKGEPGVPNVSVSNQVQVVQTDRSGRYSLPVRKPMILFISKPAGYELPVNEHQLPQFYSIHHPQGSPSGFKYAGIAPTGPLQEAVNFPLIKTHYTEAFNAVIVGDPQPRDSVEVGYFRDDIISDMVGKDARFYMALGDIAFDHLKTYEQYNRAVAQLGMPAFNVHGNHDMNFRALHDSVAAETFRRVYGPEYYSFNYGKVHFVVMDDVQYDGWNREKKKSGGYRGYFTERQLTWLKNDLQFVPQDHLLVFSVHIPIFTNYSQSDGVNVVNREAFFRLLKGRQYLLTLSAHMHIIEHLSFSAESGWVYDHSFYSINAGAGCGAWWSGPKDSRGIPESHCMDGSPNGYYVFSFDGNQFNYDFLPARYDESYQMRISQPQGVLSKAQADTTEIVVNIFDADAQSEVFFQVDDRSRKSMRSVTRKDPYILRYLKQFRQDIPGWINDGADINHIWIADLPADLKMGTHLIKVSARDSKGKLYSGVRLFEIQ
ncbi:MAG: hypothetical protein GF313_14965 [Caldithrix sp.]|nr:hypothetical protein [Caldithrix sp.]